MNIKTKPNTLLFKECIELIDEKKYEAAQSVLSLLASGSLSQNSKNLFIKLKKKIQENIEKHENQINFKSSLGTRSLYKFKSIDKILLNKSALPPEIDGDIIHNINLYTSKYSFFKVLPTEVFVKEDGFGELVIENCLRLRRVSEVFVYRKKILGISSNTKIKIRGDGLNSQFHIKNDSGGDVVYDLISHNDESQLIINNSLSSYFAVYLNPSSGKEIYFLGAEEEVV